VPDFAVSASIKAIDKLSGIFHGMGKAVGLFGNEANSAFEKAGKGAGLFRQMLGANILGNLVTSGLQRVGQYLREIPQAIEDFATRGEDIQKMSNQLGLSTDAFQRLSYAATITETPIDVMQAAMGKLNVAIGGLQRGMGPLHSTLLKLNPALAKQLLTTKSSRSAFLMIADAISRETNVQKRAAMEVAIFGKAGQGMNAMLAQGSVGLEKLMQDAGIYGSVLNDDAIAASEKLAVDTKKLKGMFGSLKDTVLSTLVVAITPYVDKALQWVTAHQDLIRQKIPEVIGDIKDAAIKLYEVAKKVVDTWNSLNALANGHLARDILLVVGAWKAVKVAIEVATAAQAVFAAASAEGGAAGVAGAIGSKALGALSAVPLAAPIAVGASAILPMMTQPEAAIHAAMTGQKLKGGNFLTNLLTRAYGFGARLRGGGKETAPNAGTAGINIHNHINVDNTAAPGVTSSVRSSPVITGNPGYQYSGAQ
jgi:hypothetical protein